MNIKLTNKDILDKLVYLDQHLGKTTFSFYQPSTGFNGNDIISVQKEARKMLDFVGLSDYTAVVTYTKTKEQEAGNIELDGSKEVFIEISDEMRVNNDRVLAVLAHEICHKVLYVNNIYFPLSVLENEIFTDLATIYVGFGKLSLNGCYNFTQNISSYRNSSGEKTLQSSIKTETVGYLNRHQFAIAYCIVCARYNVQNITDTLKDDVVSIVTEKSALFKHIELSDYKSIIADNQKDLAEISCHLRLIEDVVMRLKEDVVKQHNKIFDGLIAPLASVNDESISRNQMGLIRAAYELKEGSENSNEDILQSLRKVTSDMMLYKASTPNKGVLLNLECPHCGFKKVNALQEYKEYFLKCPQCNHLFVWKAEFTEKNDADLTDLSEKKQTIFDKFKSVFSK